MDCNYYVVNGMYYTQYDAEQALGAMNRRSGRRKVRPLSSSLTMRFINRRMMTFSRKNLQKQRRIWQTTMGYHR